MKHLLPVLFLLASFLPEALPQGFQSVYGGTGTDQFAATLQNADGSFAVAGATNMLGFGGDDIYFLKLDNIGNIQWNACYGGTAFERAYAVMAKPDGWVMAGYSSTYGVNGTSDACLLAISTDGSVQWLKSFGNTGSGELFYTAVTTADGGFAGCGYTPGITGALNGAMICKTNSLGDLQWARIYGVTSGFSGITAYDMRQTADGGFVVAGGNSRWTQGSNDVTILKISSVGALQWTRVYGGNNVDEAACIRLTPDGGFILAGRAASYGGGEEAMLMKLSSNGSFQWGKLYGSTGVSTDQAKSVVLTTDGGYLLSGNMSGFGNNNEAYLMRVSSIGAILWFNSYGGTGGEVGGFSNSLTYTSDGGILYAGSSSTTGSGLYDGHIIRADAAGVACNASVFIPTEAWFNPATTPAAPATGNPSSWTWFSYTTSGMSPATATGNWCNLLPLEWLRFEGKYEDGAVILEWETATEANTDYFAVERSMDGEDFTFAGSVRASGNSATPREYVFTDYNSIPGTQYPILYYRLRQVDFGGNHTYSENVKVKVNVKEDFLISGIHTSGGMSEIRFTLPIEGETGYEVLDASGNSVLSGSFGKIPEGVHSVSISTSELTAGIYCIVLKSGIGFVSARIVLY